MEFPILGKVEGHLAFKPGFYLALNLGPFLIGLGLTILGIGLEALKFIKTFGLLGDCLKLLPLTFIVEALLIGTKPKGWVNILLQTGTFGRNPIKVWRSPILGEPRFDF